MLSDVGGGGGEGGGRGGWVASVLNVQSLFFLLKKFGFSSRPDMLSTNIFTRNLTIDSVVRQTVKPSFNGTVALFMVN